MIPLFVAGLLQACQVVSGNVTACPGTSFNGTAVVEVDGRYRQCKIANGRAYECGGWFTGDAPARAPDGRYQRCRISTGRVFTCDGTGYTGTVVVTPRAARG